MNGLNFPSLLNLLRGSYMCSFIVSFKHVLLALEWPCYKIYHIISLISLVYVNQFLIEITIKILNVFWFVVVELTIDSRGQILINIL